MSQRTALVTGASGEMGRLLIPALADKGYTVVAMDLDPVPAELSAHCAETAQGSVIDLAAMKRLFDHYRPTYLFHLAAILSSKAEKDPDLAHAVNVEATYGLMRLCRETGTASGGPVRVLFPSSIAVYGMPDAATKNSLGAIKETEWTIPSAMYGCNKLYCELVGAYLSNTPPSGDVAALDFRAIRFPGLISAETLPTGGTTDYAPEMIHAAAQGKPYDCFVSEGTRLPFMTMPDAVEALLQLAAAEPASLSTRVYNICGFSASAGEIRDKVLEHFPGAKIGFASVAARQAIVDSWPADIDDSMARRDWGLDPRFGLDEALADYLIPALRERYAQSTR